MPIKECLRAERHYISPRYETDLGFSRVGSWFGSSYFQSGWVFDLRNLFLGLGVEVLRHGLQLETLSLEPTAWRR